MTTSRTLSHGRLCAARSGALRDTETRLRPSWLLLGPAFVAAIAYVDPGNVAANVSAGAQFGFLLVWVIFLANVMADLNWKNRRVAETEKYAHVTYFFNGGNEKPYAGEEREMAPSPKVATYDLKPEMNAVCSIMVGGVGLAVIAAALLTKLSAARGAPVRAGV